MARIAFGMSRFGSPAACKDCGGAFARSRFGVDFCGAKCRMRFNNRRTKRGGELYDLAMLNRFGDKEKGKLTKHVAALLDRWHAEDKRERSGRESWGELSYSEQRRLGVQ